MANKTAAVLFLSLLLIFKAQASVEASMVSFLVIETGVQPEGRRRQHSEQWENTLMDVFFDSGFIVSNASMMRLERKPSNGIESTIAANINEALAGGADFFIVVQLDYSQDLTYPDNINLYIYRLSANGKTLILENKTAGRAYRTEREERDGLRNIIRGFVPHLRN